MGKMPKNVNYEDGIKSKHAERKVITAITFGELFPVK